MIGKKFECPDCRDRLMVHAEIIPGMYKNDEWIVELKLFCDCGYSLPIEFTPEKLDALFKLGYHNGGPYGSEYGKM